MYLRELGCEVDWIYLAQDLAVVDTVRNARIPYGHGVNSGDYY